MYYTNKWISGLWYGIIAWISLSLKELFVSFVITAQQMLAAGKLPVLHYRGYNAPPELQYSDSLVDKQY